MIQAQLRRLVRQANVGTPTIKGQVAQEPGEGLFPGYSASGQDVWLTSKEAPYKGDSLVVSAVGARCGKVFFASGRWGVVANTAVLIPSSDVDARFLWYVVNDETFWERGTTAQPYVQMDASLAKSVPYPTLNEQRRIADFLDDQVTRIDQAVSAATSQVVLLEERRRRKVLASVRGEDRDELRSDTGVPWLGAIPKSWPVRSVGAEFEVLLARMLNEERSSGVSLRPYLRNTNVQWDCVDVGDLKVMNFPPAERPRYLLRPGDLLICEGGQPGRAAIWDGRVDEMYYQKALHRARSRGRSLPRWLFYCLLAAVSVGAFVEGSGQTTIAHLTGEQLRACRFPFPDPMEQERRFEVLDHDMRRLSDLQAALMREQELLEERKRALITAAVLGEFDVSSAGPRAADAVTG